MSSAPIVGIGVINFPSSLSITLIGTSTSLLDESEKVIFNTALACPTLDVSALVLISTSTLSGRFVIPSFNFSRLTSSFKLTSTSFTTGLNFSDSKSLTLLAVKTLLELIFTSLILSIFVKPSYQATFPLYSTLFLSFSFGSKENLEIIPSRVFPSLTAYLLYLKGFLNKYPSSAWKSTS